MQNGNLFCGFYLALIPPLPINFFDDHRHFRQKIASLLCMHKKHTVYRFELWYK